MPTTGWVSRMAPVEPAKTASPNEKIPPSDANSQYAPGPGGAVAGPDTPGMVSALADPVEPLAPTGTRAAANATARTAATDVARANRRWSRSDTADSGTRSPGALVTNAT